MLVVRMCTQCSSGDEQNVTMRFQSGKELLYRFRIILLLTSFPGLKSEDSRIRLLIR